MIPVWIGHETLLILYKILANVGIFHWIFREYAIFMNFKAILNLFSMSATPSMKKIFELHIRFTKSHKLCKYGVWGRPD